MPASAGAPDPDSAGVDAGAPFDGRAAARHIRRGELHGTGRGKGRGKQEDGRARRGWKMESRNGTETVASNFTLKLHGNRVKKRV